MAGRSLFLLSLFLQLGLFIKGQNYFIYIQSENRSSFFVKWQDRAYNSSESGYLVLPRVSSGNHVLTIGYTVDSWSVKKFNIRMKNKDSGFMLKKSGENRWQLYNLQTSEIIEAEGIGEGQAVPPPSDDAFVNILADVVDNPSLRQSSAEKENPDKTAVSALVNQAAPVTDTASRNGMAKVDRGVPTQAAPETPASKVAPVVRQDLTEEKKEAVIVMPVKDAGAQKEISQVRVEKKEPVVAVISAVPSGAGIKESAAAPAAMPSGNILLVGNSLYGRERAMSYWVREGNKTDTVDVWIEYKKKSGKEKKKAVPEVVSQTKVVPDSGEKEPDAEIPVSDGKEKAIVAVRQPPVAPVSKPAAYIFCKDTASAADFYKLRKRMANEDSEDLMLERARQAFRSKCYTIYQVRNLSYLFLDEEKKLMFLEASFPCVPDKVNFSSLENLLTDPARIERLQNLYRPKP